MLQAGIPIVPASRPVPTKFLPVPVPFQNPCFPVEMSAKCPTKIRRIICRMLARYPDVRNTVRRISHQISAQCSPDCPADISLTFGGRMTFGGHPIDIYLSSTSSQEL